MDALLTHCGSELLNSACSLLKLSRVHVHDLVKLSLLVVILLIQFNFHQLLLLFLTIFIVIFVVVIVDVILNSGRVCGILCIYLASIVFVLLVRYDYCVTSRWIFERVVQVVVVVVVVVIVIVVVFLVRVFYQVVVAKDWELLLLLLFLLLLVLLRQFVLLPTTAVFVGDAEAEDRHTIALVLIHCALIAEIGIIGRRRSRNIDHHFWLVVSL